MRTISLTETCILATKPKIVSLKTRITTAETVPKPAINSQKEIPETTAKTAKIPVSQIKIIRTCI